MYSKKRAPKGSLKSYFSLTNAFNCLAVSMTCPAVISTTGNSLVSSLLSVLKKCASTSRCAFISSRPCACDSKSALISNPDFESDMISSCVCMCVSCPCDFSTYIYNKKKSP